MFLINKSITNVNFMNLFKMVKIRMLFITSGLIVALSIVVNATIYIL